MAETKRIQVGKSDEAAAVAEKLIDAEAVTVVITIPKFAKLSESLTNFHLLKREAEVLKKKIIIESIDDAVAGFCRKAGLEFQNPFFSKPRRQFSDIVVAKQELPPQGEDGDSPRRPSRKDHREKSSMPAAAAMQESPRRRTFSLVITLAVALVLAGGAVAAVTFLPRATISIVLSKEAWEYHDTVIAAKSLTAVDAGAGKIPGQMFSQRSNFEMRFPASGRKQVSERAAGRVMIWNAHSSEPQPLVARTRFQAPDGRIVRLTRGITVPGAKVVEGKIVPSGIEAEVVADEPGAASNSDPVGHFTVPGFAGTPKEKTFYAESKTPLAGGFVGEVAVPTEDDVLKARKEITEKLSRAITTAIQLQLPKEFNLLDEAKQFTVLRENSETLPDGNGQFSIFMEAETTVMVFREEDVKQLLLKKGREKLGEDLVIHDEKLTYGKPNLNLKTGELTIPLEYQSQFVRAVDREDLKRQIAGKTERDVSTLIASLPGLEGAKVTFWPLWTHAVPEKIDRISLTVE